MAARLAKFAAFSYRGDPAVPAFPDDRPVIVYDGVCMLCAAAMRDIARRDTTGRYRFVAGQSALGRALFRHYRLDADEFETVLLIENGRCYGKLEMARRLARDLGGSWRLFQLFAPLPGRVRDWCYDRVAKNRYRLFGRSDVCMAPDASWRSRLIE